MSDRCVRYFIGGLILGLISGFVAGRAPAEELPDAPASVTVHPVLNAVAGKKVKRFTDYRSNEWLLRIDFGMRMNDAFTTWQDRPSHCTGCYERNLPQGMANSLPAMIAYGFAVHEGIAFAAGHVWGDGHDRKRRWAARGIVLADCAYDGSAGFGNYRLAKDWH